MAGINDLLKARDIISAVGKVEQEVACNIINGLENRELVDEFLRSPADQQKSMVAEWLTNPPPQAEPPSTDSEAPAGT